MTRGARLAGIFALAPSVLVGCSAPQQTPDSAVAVQSPPAPTQTAPVRRRVRPTIDERWAALADTIPGFAGLYVSGDTVVVMLVDPTRLAEAERVLRRSPSGIPAGYAHVTARRARYDSRQLYVWRRRAVNLMGDGGVVGLSIDEMRNRIRLSLIDSTKLEPVRKALLARGVPANGFILEVTGPVRFRPL